MRSRSRRERTLGQRIRHTIAVTVLLLCGFLAVALYVALFTTSGVRWLAARVTAAIPQLSLDIHDGRLWDGLEIRDLIWQDRDLRISIRVLNGTWQLPPLRQRHVQINLLHIDGVRLELPDADTPETISWLKRLDPAGREPIRLPDVTLPLDVSFDALRVTGLQVERAGQVETIDRVELVAEMSGSTLIIHYAEVNHSLFSADMSGRITLTGTYPMELRLTAGIHAGDFEKPWFLDASLDNHLADCRINLNMDGPAAAGVAGRIAPLDPAIPFDLTVSWPEIGWPLREPAAIRSRNGRVRATGSLDEYRLNAAFDLEGEQIPESRWRLLLQGDWRHMVLESLRGELLDGTVEAGGGAEWVGRSNATARIRITGLQPDILFPHAPTNVHAQAEVEISLIADGVALDVNLVEMQTHWHDTPLRASGKVSFRSLSGWRFEGIHVTSRGSSATVDASWHDEIKVHGRLNVTNLAAWHPAGQGRVTAEIDAFGTLDQPHVTFAMEGSELGWSDQVRADTLQLTGELAALGGSESHLRLQAAGIRLPARDYDLGDLRLTLDGTRDDHRFTLAVEEGLVASHIFLEGVLGETLQWAGRMTEASLAAAGFNWVLQEPVALRWNPGDQQMLVTAHEWHHDGARLYIPADMRLGAAGEAGFRLENLSLTEFSRWLPPDIEVAGMLHAALTATWDGTTPPEAGLKAEIEGGYLTMTDPDALDDEILQVPIEKFSMAAGINPRQGWTRLEMIAADMGRAEVDVVVKIGPDGVPGELDGRLMMESLDIGAALPFIPMLYTLSGKLHADIGLAGNIRDPRAMGSITVSNAVVEAVDIPVNLRGIHMKVSIDGESAALEGVFRGGAGEGSLSGEADWSGELWRALVDLHGQELEFAYDTVATVTASPDIRLQFGPGKAHISGSVTVPQADINLREMPEWAVRVSPDAVFVDDEEGDEEAEEAEETPSARLAGVQELAPTMDVTLMLGNRVNISGYGLTARLAGELEARQEIGAVPRVYGEIRIAQGEYQAYGQRLKIREGRFLFSGPVDQPSIHVEAVRSVPAHQVVAGLRVEGRPDDPRLFLFSEPAIPEDEILAFLILGRPLVGADEEGISLLARAALSLGVGGGRLAVVAEEFGIEDIHVDAVGTGEKTEVVVSGRIGPRLELSYGIGVFSPVRRLTMRYRLTRGLFLEAVSSIEDSIDLFYTFSF